jgi:nicotinate phosphoribosyltransferase
VPQKLIEGLTASYRRINLGPDRLGLFTDLYELTMAQAYLAEAITDTAVFSLFVRRLPARRNYLLACGLGTVLDHLEQVRVTDDDVAYLRSLRQFSDTFLEWLPGFRFAGDVYAVPEGTPVFANEPLLEIVAPMPQAQLVETMVMNQIHLQTVMASKAARIVHAARGRSVIDFGARRIHGIDAALKAARAFFIAGVDATSNVLAGKMYGIPVAGTMAHSYVQAHRDERAAFRAFAREFPGTTLLVDTYDTLEGVRRVIDLLSNPNEPINVRAVRLDSGELGPLARETRRLLDAAELGTVRIVASSGLDEFEIAALLDAGVPLDGFGVGARMGVSEDAPSLDIAYKLSEYAGRGRTKLSKDKTILPGRKQVFRQEEDGRVVRDVIAGSDEAMAGRALLRMVMRNGQRIEGASPDLASIRAYAAAELERLPARLRDLSAAEPPYAVEVSAALDRSFAEVRRDVSLHETPRDDERGADAGLHTVPRSGC